MPNYSGIWTEQAVMQANGAGNWPNAPGAPTIGTATNTGAGGAVSVAFTAPTFAGLPATITSYTVTSSPGGVTGTGASSPITVSGLTNGTAYTFTVTATNASGTGPASAASNSVTPSLIVYVEDVMSTYLYTGTGAALTITNGIDLSTKGGLVWGKNRSTDATFGQNYLSDTSRGITSYLVSNNTDQQFTPGNVLTSANTTGFSIGDSARLNNSGVTYVSWTFRKQPKFFDIVTYTGNGSSPRTISHNLGSVPGCIIVKRYNISGQDWFVHHRSLSADFYGVLNDTAAFTNSFSSTIFNDTAPTSTVFSIGSTLNQNGNTYVAYLFAHDAGGFGLTGTDNVISCGSYTGTGAAGNTVNLGYEPQWLMVKNASAAEGDGWVMLDVMRGMPNFFATDQSCYLSANSSSAEQASNLICPTATGFYIDRAGNPLNTNAQTYIYIAIRRGPMKVPTVGTSVFLPTTYTGNGATGQTITTGFPVDFSLFINSTKSNSSNNVVFDRLRGGTRQLATNVTDAESALGSSICPLYDNNTGVKLQGGTVINANTASFIVENFRRAPGFFDEVCYTGTGSTTTQAHNLTVAPELMIVKSRSASANWTVYSSATGNTNALLLNDTTGSFAAATTWNNTTPTSSVFSIGTSSAVNTSTATYVAYLFATCAGVSKVGSYTGTATTLQIDCGFTAGSRFVLIKRTDSTGDWYVWDSARGIVAGNDPYLLLNSTAAEVTNTDYVDTYSAGFEISSTAPAAINANGGTYIFLAIA
jgi:hypothetical protein